MPAGSITTLAATGDITIALPGLYQAPGPIWTPGSLTIADAGAFVFSGDAQPTLAPSGVVALDAGFLAGFLIDGGTVAIGAGILDGTVRNAHLRGGITLAPVLSPYPGPAAVRGLSLEFRDGFDLLAADGIGPGTLRVADTYANLRFTNVPTIDNATITLISQYFVYGTQITSATTTLGPDLDIDLIGAPHVTATGTLVNDGTIRVAPTSAASLTASAIVGHGTIDIAPGGTLNFGADQSPAQWRELLAQVVGSGVIGIFGTVENAGSILDLRPGTPFGRVAVPRPTSLFGSMSNLQVEGGTVLADGIVPMSLTLHDVTVRGSADVFNMLVLPGSLSITDANGTLPGVLDVSGIEFECGSWQNRFNAPTTLAMGTLRLGLRRDVWSMVVSPAATLALSSMDPWPGYGGQTVVASNRGVILAETGDVGPLDLRGNTGTLSLAPGALLSTTIDNNAGLVAIGAGATLTARFTGTIGGRISLDPAGVLVVNDSTIASDLFNVLTGSLQGQGTIRVGGDIANAGRTLRLSALGAHGALAPGRRIFGGTILADATVALDGVTLDAVAWRGKLASSAPPGGTIAIFDGIDFPERADIDLTNGSTLDSFAGALVPGGTVRLGGGGALARRVTLAPATTTLVTGPVTLGAGVVNQGSIQLTPGGRLELDGAVNLGQIALAGGNLVAGANTRQLGTVRMGSGGLYIDANVPFDVTGTLLDFQNGGSLVLFGTGLLSNNFFDPPVGVGAVNGQLVVSVRGVGVAHFALPGAPTALFASLAFPGNGPFLTITTASDPPQTNPDPLVLPQLNGLGTNVTFDFRTEEALQRAQLLLSPNLFEPGLMPSAIYHPGTTPTVPASNAHGVLVIDTTGAIALPDAFGAALIDAAGPVQIVGNSFWGHDILAGSGGTVLLGQAPEGVFITTGGDNVFFGANAPGHRWSVLFGDGDDVAVGGAGTLELHTGGGRNTAWLGAGGGTVEAQGNADIVVGGAGASTVSLDGGSDAVFGGNGPMEIWAGAGDSTILGATSGTTLYGGTGRNVIFGAGPLTYYGGAGSDTLVGGGGAITAIGGAAGGVFWGGTGGPNSIDVTGDATVVGGGPGDMLRAHGTGTHIFYGGGGAETISAINSWGTDVLLAGTGPALLQGGAGSSLLIAGPGGGTLSGGLGASLFEFINGYGAAAVTVAGFDPARSLVALTGFGPGAIANALSGASVAADGLSITLPDGTRVLFQGIASLAPSSFL